MLDAYYCCGLRAILGIQLLIYFMLMLPSDHFIWRSLVVVLVEAPKKEIKLTHDPTNSGANRMARSLHEEDSKRSVVIYDKKKEIKENTFGYQEFSLWWWDMYILSVLWDKTWYSSWISLYPRNMQSMSFKYVTLLVVLNQAANDRLLDFPVFIFLSTIAQWPMELNQSAIRTHGEEEEKRINMESNFWVCFYEAQ